MNCGETGVKEVLCAKLGATCGVCSSTKVRLCKWKGWRDGWTDGGTKVGSEGGRVT